MSGSVQQTDASVSSELQHLYSTLVEPDQIDQLGHMNVRFYGVHALAGARELVARIGLPDLSNTEGATRSEFTDLYTRHYREQLEGAALEVWGGVLEVGTSEIQMYFELRNPALEEFGATFVFAVRHVDSASRAPVALPDAVAAAAHGLRVAWPEHGQPRSIDLNAAPREYALEELAPLGLPGRAVRTIAEKDCDANGVYRVDTFQDLIWGTEGISEDNDWLRTLENGDRMGWATMESRCTLHELPRVGTRVQSYCAVVDVQRKANHERFWVYDLERGTLLCTASFVEVAFNINMRRAIEIPDFEQARLKEHFHPELV